MFFNKLSNWYIILIEMRFEPCSLLLIRHSLTLRQLLLTSRLSLAWPLINGWPHQQTYLARNNTVAFSRDSSCSAIFCTRYRSSSLALEDRVSVRNTWMKNPWTRKQRTVPICRTPLYYYFLALPMYYVKAQLLLSRLQKTKIVHFLLDVGRNPSLPAHRIQTRPTTALTRSGISSRRLGMRSSLAHHLPTSCAQMCLRIYPC